MSDVSVAAALRSDAGLAVIEAPGGCGKTYQGAKYAGEIVSARGAGRLLILTHTHAACSVFAGRTSGTVGKVEIRTIDSLIAQVASAYHQGLGLPADAAAWARQSGGDGYGEMAVKVAALLNRYPGIAGALAQRYPLLVCDEHQDCSGEQHAIIWALHKAGAKLRVFADPMQKISKERALIGGCLPCDWAALIGQADRFEQLDTPHRWADTDPALGAWILQARATLKAGGRVDLSGSLPTAVQVVIAENQATAFGDYRLPTLQRQPIDRFVRGTGSMLILTPHNKTASSFRSFFGRRIPLWEGHTRSALDSFISALENATTPQLVGVAVVEFMGSVAVGFSASQYGNRFQQEIADGCTAQRRLKPAKIQALAKLVVDQPNHIGACTVLRRIGKLRQEDSDFGDIQIDNHREFWEACRLAEYEDFRAGFAQITHQRTYARPKPPEKAISTIHKAKGLECESVLLMPCDSKTFPDKPEARCLLYVALSRPTKHLMLVVSRDNPSPFLNI